MASYKVIEKGFHGGKTYDPHGKRRTLHVEKAFKKCPSWLEPIKAEKSQSSNSDNGPTVKDLKDKLTELGIEFNKSAKKDELVELLANAEKKADDQEIENASFMGVGEQASGSNVETL